MTPESSGAATSDAGRRMPPDATMQADPPTEVSGESEVSESIVIYHNPRCSKSRAALALLRDRGVEPEVVEYLKTPLDADAVRGLLGALGMSVRDLLRSGEAPYRELGLAEPDTSEDDLIEAIAAHPILMQRPVVRRGRRAVVGRPPERVADLLDP